MRTVSDRLLIVLVAVFATLLPSPVAAQYWYHPYYWGPAYYAYESDLKVRVTPADAFVYVDGYFNGQVEEFDGTFQRLHLEPGTHEIVVYLKGYRPLIVQFYFSPHQTKTITGTLMLLQPGEPDTGPPTPSEPPDEPRGERPAPRQSRRPEPVEPPRTVFAPADSTSGTLSIRVEPENVEIEVGGTRRIVRNNDYFLVQLPGGRHTVQATKKGYRTFTTEVEVKNGETTIITVALTRER